MIGRRKIQTDMFDVGNVFPYSPDPKSYYGQLAKVSDQLFDDDEFSSLYSDHMGRPSVPPSLLALVLIMQGREQLSDEEAIRRTTCDLDWAVVLRRQVGVPLCAKSTLQCFRAQLLANEKLNAFLVASLRHARKKGLLKGQQLKQAVDTKPIFGRGAVEDTFNLIGHAMNCLLRTMASESGQKSAELIAEHNLSKLAAPSVKGAVDIDWSDEAARNDALCALVSDARRLIALADGGNPKIKTAASLLEQILLQDVVETKMHDGSRDTSIKEGTATGRVPSVTDPEQRHGRKSAAHRFTGHKASVSVDVDTGLILAADVLAGDAPDSAKVIELTELAETNSGCMVVETLADCAYGSGATRQQFADANRVLIAKVAAEARTNTFPKGQFAIDLPDAGQSLEQTTVTCPAGHASDMLSPDGKGGVTFYFDEHCALCALRTACTTSKYGRSVHIHAQERLIQEARTFQASKDGRAKLRERLVVENGLARLGRLGIGQARFIGRAKTRFQLVIAATVANLRRTWNWEAAQPA
jgi:transposase